jgi:hypothetical protein
MSFVTAQPEALTAAAGTLQGIGSWEEHFYPLAAEAERGAGATCR